jgi:hypothetical protein
MWRWWIGVVLIFGGAACLTLLAYREGLPDFIQRIPQSDKVVHFGIGGLLAFFLDGALRRGNAFTIAGFVADLLGVVVLLLISRRMRRRRDVAQ